MNYAKLILPLLVLLNSITLYAQNPLDYYPLHVGDKRIYESYKGGLRRISPIARDSVVNNDSLHYYFPTLTTTVAYVLDNVKKTLMIKDTKDKQVDPDVVLRLDVQIHETYPVVNSKGDTFAFHQLIEEFDGQVLGRRVKTRHYWKYPNSPTPDGYHEYFAEGIGYILRTLDVGSDIEYIVGCVVNGDTLGDVSDITTSVENGTPTINTAMVFPNPSSDRVFLNTGTLSHNNIIVSVYNTLGNAIPVQVTRIATDVVSLDVSNLEQGTYRIIYNVGKIFGQQQFVVVR
ncbi:MAG: T9SS type A sorting domain-containing protein [Candidatus Kapabacteria bacterium]|nr:T9SS type A sorting domain-containing protein [Candidatus Kapabacteria bacterium]